MAIQQEKGELGEDIAVDFLQNKGYEIVERNYRAGKSEIDIIARSNNILIIVEVKARSSIRFGHPEEFVNEAKARKVVEGAEAYIDEKGWGGRIRFDIISVLFTSNTPEISHFEDVFY